MIAEKDVFVYVLTMYVDDMRYQSELYDLNCRKQRIADASAVNPYIETCTDNVISDMFETDEAIDYLWEVVSFSDEAINYGALYDKVKEIDQQNV